MTSGRKTKKRADRIAQKFHHLAAHGTVRRRRRLVRRQEAHQFQSTPSRRPALTGGKFLRHETKPVARPKLTQRTDPLSKEPVGPECRHTDLQFLVFFFFT